jgi:multidrug efflux pump subunit AcrB
MNRLIEFFVKQKIFSDLISVFIIVVGVACMLLMKREAFPNIKFDTIIVNTIFPGATPEQVERLITNPLEIELKEVDGIKKVTSVSRTSTSLIILQLDPDQATEAEAKADIQDVVDRFKALPEDAERPVVTSLEGGIYPIIQVSLTADLSPIELRQYAREIEKDLETIPGVAKITPTGMQDLEIHVEADLNKLSQLRLSFEEVITALKSQNVSIPGGSISNSAGQEVLIRTSGDFETIEHIENTVIRANDLAQTIRVRDIAKVGFRLKDDDRLFRTNGSHAINLTVLRKNNADSITLVEAVKARVASLEKKYEGKLNFRLLDDESIWIKMRLNTLTSNFIIGLILVVIILSLLLPPVIALIVALGIPFAFFGTMIVFYNIGYSLNLLSMLGLIIVVGMLVDDAVVATENSMRLLEEGASPEDAAVKGTQQVVSSIFGSVMTTVLAFLPLMFMTGIFGKFVEFIPMGVIVALIISLVEAFFILPSHFARWAHRPQDKSRKHFLDRFYERSLGYWQGSVLPAYIRAVTRFVKYRYRVLGGLVVAFATSLFVASKLSFVLFPAEGIEIFFVTADAPLGSKLEATSELVRPIEKLIRELPDGEVQDFTTQLGMQQKDPGDPNTKYGSHVAMIVVYLTPVKDRERHANAIVDELREKTKNISGLKIAFEKVNPGPPVGKPISIGIQGQEYTEILQLAERVKTEIANLPGTSDLELSHQPGNKELIVDVNSSEAAAAGLTVAGIGQSVRAAFEGIVPTSIKKLDEEIDIRVSLPDKTAADPSTMSKLVVPNQQGQLVSLGKVASFRETQGIAAYIHENNRREVRVIGQLDSTKTDAGKVQSHIQKLIPQYKEQFPNLNISFGGENEDTAESMASLARTFSLAFVGIFLILVLTFQRLLQPLLVVVTIPIGIMGVIFTFLIHGAPLSFMGMLGMIALSGVIVNNAIILVDFVNQLRAEGLEHEASIIKAAGLRLRPIFLTTITTVAGVLPTAYGIGGNDDFVKPIALALGWGLFSGSLITVFFFPSVIAILDDAVAVARRWLRRG